MTARLSLNTTIYYKERDKIGTIKTVLFDSCLISFSKDEPNKEITFFFNKSEIMSIIEKEAPVEWKRDIKIESILKN